MRETVSAFHGGHRGSNFILMQPRLYGGNLIDVVWPIEDRSNSYIRGLVLALLGTLLLTVAEKVQVPLWPVPMTMGTFVVLGLGMIYGWRLAGATMLLYLSEGAIGLPVFAGTPQLGIGLTYMMGTTGGYLIGFVLAAMLVGWLAEKGWDRSMMGTVLAMLVGTIVIYVPGILWLGFLIGWDQSVIELGLSTFILGDVIKLALATILMPLAWRFVGKRSSRRSIF